MNSRDRFSFGAPATFFCPSNHTSIAGSVSIASASARKLPRVCPECLILREHQRGVPHLAGGGGEMVVPQERQFLHRGLIDLHHAPQPPAAELPQLVGDLAPTSLADRRVRALPQRRDLSLNPPRSRQLILESDT